MSNPISRSVRRLSSRSMEIWRSLLLWMHWRLRARRREKELLELLERLLINQVQAKREMRHLRLELEVTKQQLQDSLHSQLMAALRPLADAMLRQDSLHREYHQDQVHLLLEVLSNQRPSAEEQISQQIGPLPPKKSSPSLAS